MTKLREVQFTAIFLTFAALALYVGWRNLWFLTDDAYIAFRYVSNSVLGYGYVWNAAPFHPVEGYTSFLWVIVLEYVWRLFGILPPQSANVISLVFSFLSMAVCSLAVLRMNLSKALSHNRLLLILLLLVSLVTSRTFLTWSSSGLETGLFNFCFHLWIFIAVFWRQNSLPWLFGVSASAALVYLARPDGMLIYLATLILVSVALIRKSKSGRVGGWWLVSILPLAIPVFHLLWRRSFYGEWLPNTYYAKHVGAWPEAGIRYFASFLLEHGLWIWIVVLVSVIVVALLGRAHGWRDWLSQTRDRVRNEFSAGSAQNSRWLPTVITVSTVMAHLAYYTLVIGGDHFEWRVYSHLLPLAMLSLFYLLSALDLSRGWSIGVVITLILFSLPIPWAHYNATGSIVTLRVSDTVKKHVTDELPAVLSWLTEPQDALQDWLINHHVCIRRKEHENFWQQQIERYPDRTEDLPPAAGPHPVAYFSTAGVPGWVLPRVAIIDGFGLNDYVIARHAPYPRRERLMAHDRYPPDGYIGSFLPNVRSTTDRQFDYTTRLPDQELTAERIMELEQFWIDRIVHGVERLDSGQFLPDIGTR